MSLTRITSRAAIFGAMLVVSIAVIMTAATSSYAGTKVSGPSAITQDWHGGGHGGHGGGHGGGRGGHWGW